MKAKDIKEKYNKIKEKKSFTRVEEICAGFPEEFATYLKYCRALKFMDKPDYSYLRTLFKNLYKQLGFASDYQYCWCDEEARAI